MELINDSNYCAKETYLEDFARPLTVSFDFRCKKRSLPVFLATIWSIPGTASIPAFLPRC